MSWQRWVVGACAVLFGIGVELATGAWGSPLGTADLVVGLVFAGLGLLMAEPRRHRTATLMVAIGLAWLAGNLANPLLLVHRGPLVHLLVGYPLGRLRGWPARIVVGAAYLEAGVYPLGHDSRVSAGLCLAVLGTIVVGYLRSSKPERRARIAGLVSAVSIMTVLGVAAATRLARVDADSLLLWAYQLALLGVATVVYVDYRWGPWRRATVTGLALDLGQLEEGGGPQAKLAAALGDPSVQLVYWMPEARGYVDIAGRPVEVPAAGDPNRVLTVLEHKGNRLGALVHDASVAEDPALVADIVSLAGIALVNARLQAAARTGVVEVEASRRRIVAAADAERRRLERELRDGAERRLLVAGELLGSGGIERAGLRDLLAGSLAELNAFARGVHPRTLTRSGLPAALAELAGVTPLRVELDVVEVPLPREIAAGVYFVCSEALANATKHAGATTIVVRVRRAGGGVTVEVSDDGMGGADPDRGTGLQGLADRVAALGGVFHVDTSATGTRLVCTFPI